MDRTSARNGAQRWGKRSDLGHGNRTLAEERVVFEAGVQLLDFFDDAAHLVDRVIAALGRAGVAGLAAQVNFDLHAAAMAAVNPQLARLGDHHAIGANAVLFEDVEPWQAVAVFLLHGTDHVDRVVTLEAALFDELAGVDHAGHAGALVAGAAAENVAILHLALVRVPGPFFGIAHAHRIGVGVHHDHGSAGADAAQDVAHGVYAGLVEAHLFHLLANARDHRPFVRAFGGDGDEVAQEADDIGLIGLRQLGQARGGMGSEWGGRGES